MNLFEKISEILNKPFFIQGAQRQYYFSDIHQGVQIDEKKSNWKLLRTQDIYAQKNLLGNWDLVTQFRTHALPTAHFQSSYFGGLFQKSVKVDCNYTSAETEKRLDLEEVFDRMARFEEDKTIPCLKTSAGEVFKHRAVKSEIIVPNDNRHYWRNIKLINAA